MPNVVQIIMLVVAVVFLGFAIYSLVYALFQRKKAKERKNFDGDGKDNPVDDSH